ncbi:ATP-binding protein, partial [Francisella tularensis]|uniref:ATP-binding protein n=1 Tax=Francisella tularensis TaxID=263 RepID=UPI002381CC24
NQKFRFILPKEPFEIEVDPVLFQQVILNLIDIAVKFTCDFEKEIIISLKRKKAAFFLFEVQNKCIGLRESDMEKIFTIFHRIEK